MANPWDDYRPAAASTSAPWQDYAAKPAAPAATATPPPERTFMDSVKDAGEKFWDWTGKPAAYALGLSSGTDAERGAKARDAQKQIVQGIVNEPARIRTELTNSLDAFVAGNPRATLHHALNAIPMVGAGINQIAQEADQGKYADAVGHTAALALPAVAAEAPAVAGAVADGAGAVADAAKSAAPIMGGALKGAGKAIPGAIETSVLKYTGAPQILRGAYEGGKAAFAKSRAAQAATEAASAAKLTPAAAVAPAAAPTTPPGSPSEPPAPPAAPAAAPAAPVEAPKMSMADAEADMKASDVAKPDQPGPAQYYDNGDRKSSAVMAAQDPQPGRSQYYPNGDKKSPEVIAAEIEQFNRTAKADRFAKLLNDQGVSLAQAKKMQETPGAWKAFAKDNKESWAAGEHAGTVAETLDKLGEIERNAKAAVKTEAPVAAAAPKVADSTVPTPNALQAALTRNGTVVAKSKAVLNGSK